MPLEPKQFYVARRNASLSPEEFRAQWRAHGDLAMGSPLWSNIFRYTQGDRVAVPEEVAGRLIGLDSDSDGVATIWFRDLDAMMAIPADPDHPVLLRDEARIFADMVADVSIFTEEQILHEAGQAAVKVVVFAGGPDPAAVAEAYRTHAAVLEADAEAWPLVSAYRINPGFELPMAEGAEAGENDGPGRLDPYAAAVEMAFAGPDDLATVVTSPAFAAAEAVLDGVVDRRLTLVTSELLLYAEG